jgi:hypothetical protein
MTIVEQTSAPRLNPSAARVRRHRERRRDGLRLFTVPVPMAVIENAIARELLAAEDRAEPWPVIQGCYAAQLSDAALDWLRLERITDNRIFDLVRSEIAEVHRLAGIRADTGCHAMLSHAGDRI